MPTPILLSPKRGAVDINTLCHWVGQWASAHRLQVNPSTKGTGPLTECRRADRWPKVPDRWLVFRAGGPEHSGNQSKSSTPSCPDVYTHVGGAAQVSCNARWATNSSVWKLIQPGLATSAEVGATRSQGYVREAERTRLAPRTRTLRILAPTIGSRSLGIRGYTC